MKEFKINEAVCQQMIRKSLDTMDSINAKWCQEELERIKAGTTTDANFDCGNCPHSCYDPKTAFLSELQSLLKRYNAYIFPCGHEVDGLSIVINDKDEIHYDMYEWSTMHDLSADNIFNYDKEAIPSHIQGIVLSEEQNNFFDRLIPKEEFRNRLNRNDK